MFSSFEVKRVFKVASVKVSMACCDHTLSFILFYFDAESHELVSWMRGHDSSIHNISVHASGRYALTSSNSVAQLWDLDTFSRKRTLNGAQTVGIQQVWI